jgi:hypothetical protein
MVVEPRRLGSREPCAGATSSVYGKAATPPGQLLVTRGTTGNHDAGVDGTFSAPKAVCVLWAPSDRDTRTAVEAANEQAVLAALEHIEDLVPSPGAGSARRR